MPHCQQTVLLSKRILVLLKSGLKLKARTGADAESLPLETIEFHTSLQKVQPTVLSMRNLQTKHLSQCDTHAHKLQAGQQRNTHGKRSSEIECLDMDTPPNSKAKARKRMPTPTEAGPRSPPPTPGPITGQPPRGWLAGGDPAQPSALYPCDGDVVQQLDHHHLQATPNRLANGDIDSAVLAHAKALQNQTKWSHMDAVGSPHHRQTCSGSPCRITWYTAVLTAAPIRTARS